MTDWEKKWGDWCYSCGKCGVEIWKDTYSSQLGLYGKFVCGDCRSWLCKFCTFEVSENWRDRMRSLGVNVKGQNLCYDCVSKVGERIRKAHTCEICETHDLEGKYHDCPDCNNEFVCEKCWDRELSLCKICRKKFEMLKAPELQISQKSSNTLEDAVDGTRYGKRLVWLRNALEMSSKVPLGVISKSLEFPSVDDLSAWLFEQGIVGLKIDYDTSFLVMVDDVAIEMIGELLKSQEENLGSTPLPLEILPTKEQETVASNKQKKKEVPREDLKDDLDLSSLFG